MDRDTPYTRVIEHKHFEFGTTAKDSDYQGVSGGGKMAGGHGTLLSGE